MILNRFKLAAARRKIAQIVSEQEAETFSGEVKSLGIILDNKNRNARKELQEIKTKLKITDSNFKVVLFTGNDKKPSDFDAIEFRRKHIDFNAEIINEDLKDFTAKGVDLLITFAGESNTAVHLLTAYCKAGIKVGRYQQNKALYDLILQTEGDASLFVEELLKYIKLIKRI